MSHGWWILQILKYHSSDGMSQFWRYVIVLKVCHSSEGMSHFITTFMHDILAKLGFFELPIKIPIIWVICVPPSIDILSRVNINNGLVLITLMWRKQVAFYYLFKAVKITPSKYNGPFLLQLNRLLTFFINNWRHSWRLTLT